MDTLIVIILFVRCHLLQKYVYDSTRNASDHIIHYF